MKKSRQKKIIPGFGLSLGITLAVLALLVWLPLAALAFQIGSLSWSQFWACVTRPRVLSGFWVSISCALVAAMINLAMGVTLAWVLVRYDFPGKRFFDGLIELPFALPTAIAGIALTSLCAENGWIGRIFAPLGISISFTRIGIVVALIFVGIPFVVRAVQPVLEKLDPLYEEAAHMLGADPARTFFRVVLPELAPAALTGFGLAFARGMGEYGSVVFIAGNQPNYTEIAPLLIYAQLQEFDYAEATAIALVMLAISFALLLLMNIVQHHAANRTKA